MNIDFLLIWHFEVVVLERSIILTQTVGRFNMRVTPFSGILTLAMLKYLMSKDLSTNTLKSCTASNNTRRHLEQRTRNTASKG